MKKLIEYTKILRSKNAGPLYLTFDLIFPDSDSMKYVEERLTREKIALAFDITPEEIRIIPYGVVNSIKITFPRKHISGSPEDEDIYGCQQHLPLAEIVL